MYHNAIYNAVVTIFVCGCGVRRGCGGVCMGRVGGGMCRGCGGGIGGERVLLGAGAPNVYLAPE